MQRGPCMSRAGVLSRLASPRTHQSLGGVSLEMGGTWLTGLQTPQPLNPVITFPVLWEDAEKFQACKAEEGDCHTVLLGLGRHDDAGSGW